MADEEVEDGNGQEPTSPIDESKNGSLVEFEITPEEMAEEMEDEAALNGEDLEGTNGETDEGEGEPEGEGGASSEKIEQPSKDSKDALGKENATDVGDGDEEESTKKKLDKQQCQKVKRLQCGRQFREIIGKRESKKEELEKREGDLRQRLDVLECSMPAVMVWNVWQRMAQGGPVPNLHRLMEKQFRAPAAGEVCCPRSPSQHYDCRVREIEAERKEAQRRLEEARELWLDKEAKLKDRREKLEEAKRIQEERKEKLERLTKEASELREALKKMDEEATAEEEQMFAGACESGDPIMK
ncbi:hypothetical protein KPH14_009533 [Odynerus spinipes]|uniref:Uncharacterized protein n=1 Tax=Odynerus spinipes TaxID=1348599 RepID=A0AAD9RPJ8_9HYME|nr:hypothetical protein KPH14_009533 [Odynerus spinipes]